MKKWLYYTGLREVVWRKPTTLRNKKSFLVYTFRRYPDPPLNSTPMDIPPQRMISSTATNKKHKRTGSTKTRQHPPPPQLQRSFSSSEEDLKSTPEYGSDEHDSEKGKLFYFASYVCAIGDLFLRIHLI